MKIKGNLGADGAAIAVVVTLIALSIAWAVLMIWWLIWSIFDLAHGNPVTFWNIAGIVVPALSILGGIARR